MSLINSFKTLFFAGRVIPKRLWEELENLDSRISTSDDIKTFTSEEQTGTGEAQTIPHGLGATPTLVWIEPTLIGTDGATFAEGTHGSVNCSVTATTGAKYIVKAMLTTAA